MSAVAFFVQILSDAVFLSLSLPRRLFRFFYNRIFLAVCPAYLIPELRPPFLFYRCCDVEFCKMLLRHCSEPITGIKRFVLQSRRLFKLKKKTINALCDTTSSVYCVRRSSSLCVAFRADIKSVSALLCWRNPRTYALLSSVVREAGWRGLREMGEG